MLAMKGLAVLLFLGLVSGAKYHNVSDAPTIHSSARCQQQTLAASLAHFIVTEIAESAVFHLTSPNR
jgi:hypothetical protein